MRRLSRLILLMPTPIEQRTASQKERKPDPALRRTPLIVPPTSRAAFCVWQIFPFIRSTALARYEAILWRQAGREPRLRSMR